MPWLAAVRLPRAWAAWCGLALALAAGHVTAQPARAASGAGAGTTATVGALALAEGTPTPARVAAQVWVDEHGTATLQEVLERPQRFAPGDPEAVYRLGEGSALWLRLKLVRTEGDRPWLLVVPHPVLDRISVWQQDARGRWRQETAGDTVAVDQWPEAGRYPAFRLDLPTGQPREVYARVQSLTPTSVPLRLATDSAHSRQAQIEYLGLGMAYGALLLLIVACLAQSWAYRDSAYGWYAAYASVSMLAVMAYTGVAGHLLWPFSGSWADQSQGVLACLALAAAMLFVRSLTGIAARHVQLDRLSRAGSWIGAGLAIAFPLMQRPAGVALASAYLLGASATNMLIAGLAWRRRDAVGLWVLGAYVPLALALALTLLRVFGWLPVSFLTQYAVVVAMTIQVPLLLVALSVRSRERHGAEIREQALSSQDALTGLLAPHLFQDRLQQVVSRFKRHREDAAVVFIDLVNHERIKAYHGQTVAEQSLLRSVIKLRRLVRDIDTVGRVGEARFGLIMEGVRTRAVVTDRAARLIAAGLMPLQGLKPDVTLQFHVAAVLLCERMVEADELPRELGSLLASMSPRTRRPIRFLQPEDTVPAPLADTGGGAGAPDSELPQDAAPVRAS
jgi:diguanylate cyclase (GGDEF)-like protein